MTDIGNVNFSFDICMPRLRQALTSEDDIGSIIRCHFEAERAATHVLEVLTAGRFAKVSERKGRYLSDKLNLLEILGVAPLQLEPIRSLNRHRNRFAHDGQDVITESHVTELWGTLSLVAPNMTRDSRYTLGNHARYQDVRICNLDAREQYVIAACAAVALLAAFPEILASTSPHYQTSLSDVRV